MWLGGGALATALVLLATVTGVRACRRNVRPAATATTIPSAAPSAPAAHPAPEVAHGFLHGRVTTVDGAVLEGRLRWGGDQEAFWSDLFHGSRREHRWLELVPPERRPRRRHPVEVFGFRLAERERPLEPNRRIVAPFGSIARLDARGREIRVTFRSGTVADLDRLEASDLDDGLRVWDARRGRVDLDSLRIRSVEFLPTPALAAAPWRLQGTVRTTQGDFTGFLVWTREQRVGTDELEGRTSDGEVRLRFETIRSLERRSPEGCRVTRLDGSEWMLSGTADVGRGDRSISVEDRRFGWVRIPWRAFERVDFAAGGSGPAFDELPAGRPLAGAVTTRGGRPIVGRLVFDLDESETTDTLDAPREGLNYGIPFDRIASIVPPRRDGHGDPGARVTLRSGDVLPLEAAGDLDGDNAGLLVFAGEAPHPEYVPWSDVGRIDFDDPSPRPPSSAPGR